MTRGTASFFRDNLEAFAVAIAMALVLRHYCIEAFRIPTKSMMASLLGDDGARRRHGDRILVDKFVAMRRDPRRGEVWVFQYPLNRNRNFIKRVAGLPNEWLRIVDGDLWVSTDEGATWAIQRKPEGIREQLFFPYYPRPVDNPDAFAGKENWELGAGWRVSEREGIFKI
ncbi:MAG: signal peptidase I, partial [Planctomycetota bacterium]